MAGTQRVLYTDKETFQVSPLDEINKATAPNYNELKNVVNFNAQALDDILSLTTIDVSAIQNTFTSDITAQTGTKTFTLLDSDITTAGRTSTGEVNYINFKKDTVEKFKVDIDGNTTADGLVTGGRYFSSLDGSLGTVAFGWASDPDMGFIRTGAGLFSAVNNGIITVDFDGSNNITLPNGSLEVAGGTIAIGTSPIANVLIGATATDPSVHSTTALSLGAHDAQTRLVNADQTTLNTPAYQIFLTHGTDGANAISYVGSISPVNGDSALVFGTTVSGVTAEDMRIQGGNVTIGNGNFALLASASTADYNSGDGVIFIGDATTNPTTATVTDGGLLYVDGNALNFLDAGGTVTDLTTAGSGLFIQTALISVSSAELLAINTTPITLIAAPGAGKRIIVHNVSSTFTFVTAAYTGDTSLQLKYSGSSSFLPLININSAVNRFANHGGHFYNTTTDDFTNNSVVLTTGASDPLTGSGTITYVLEYSIVTI